jgi:transcription termination/antitermination protein NusG
MNDQNNDNNEVSEEVTPVETVEETTVEAAPETTTETVEATTEEAPVAASEETTEESSEENSEEATEEEGPVHGSGPEFKWYIAKTLTGQENKIVRALKERIVNFNLSESFADVLTPEETVVTNANGKKRTLKKKFFPGYVLIKMIMNEHTWHLVKDTDKITGFVGGTLDKPAPITNEEANYMLGQVEDGVKKPRTTVDFEEGEEVKVTEGPFASFVGVVEQVNEKGKIRVSVSIFGRPTPVELDFSQVEKVS